jgi:putative ABC transport system permease protein
VRLSGAIVSWDLFPLLKVQPMLGRGFLPSEEEAGARVVVLSYAVWQGRFGGDPSIAGRTIIIDRQPHIVVGVAPPGFNLPALAEPVEMWATLGRDAASATITPLTRQRGTRMLHAVARLKPGVSLIQAQGRMDAAAAAIALDHPDSNKNLDSTLVQPALERLVGEVRNPLLILLAAAGLVLLMMCANIAKSAADPHCGAVARIRAAGRHRGGPRKNCAAGDP